MSGLVGSVSPMWLEDGCWAGALSETVGNLAGEFRPAGDMTEGRIIEGSAGDRSEDRLDMAGVKGEQENLYYVYKVD